MKLYEVLSKEGFHTTVATSFAIDFDAYENIMLARFRGSGCNNNLLVLDAGMLSFTLEGSSPLPRHAGRSYTVTPAAARGVFHPKIILQLGRASARMIVSSANATAAGLAGNLEIAGVVDMDDAASGEARLIAAGWSFLSRFLDRRLVGVGRQLDWMHARTPWLRGVEPADGPITLSDGTDAALFATGGASGIGTQFLAAVAGEKVRRLIVVSPYWDDDLGALNRLLDAAAPTESCILLDQDRHVFHAQAIADRQRRRVKLISYKANEAARFVHAKLIIAQTTRRDHVLYGSANCTVAALGNARFQGANEEACLYRALPRGVAVERLGLAEALDSAPLSLKSFRSAEPPESIPLGDVVARSPGSFACMLGTLIWSPPPGANPATDRIELLGRDGEVIATQLRRLPDRPDGDLRFELAGSERPHFAIVMRRDGVKSTPAIVAILDELHSVARDARTRRIEMVLQQLDAETDIALSLLEAVEELEEAEKASGEGGAVAGRRGAARKSKDEPAASPRTLDYEQFMAGRRVRSEIAGLNRDSLAGSYLTHVRGLLNRVVGIRIEPPGSRESEDAAYRFAFDLGDEVTDGEEAVEEGIELANQMPHAQKPIEADEDRARRLARYRRDSREQLISAVDTLVETVPGKAADGGLRSSDILRLRVVVLIIASAAWNGAAVPRRATQVLPPTGDIDGSWPRLLGKVLNAYFGGRRCAIATLKLDSQYDELPDDILECWATCIWATSAALATSQSHHEHPAVTRALEKLRDTIFRVVSLSPAEFRDAHFLRVIEGLNTRFAVALGYKETDILKPQRIVANNVPIPPSRAGLP